jgi:hypothetical protein
MTNHPDDDGLKPSGILEGDDLAAARQGIGSLNLRFQPRSAVTLRPDLLVTL